MHYKWYFYEFSQRQITLWFIKFLEYEHAYVCIHHHDVHHGKLSCDSLRQFDRTQAIVEKQKRSELIPLIIAGQFTDSLTVYYLTWENLHRDLLNIFKCQSRRTVLLLLKSDIVFGEGGAGKLLISKNQYRQEKDSKKSVYRLSRSPNVISWASTFKIRTCFEICDLNVFYEFELFSRRPPMYARPNYCYLWIRRTICAGLKILRRDEAVLFYTIQSVFENVVQKKKNVLFK